MLLPCRPGLLSGILLFVVAGGLLTAARPTAVERPTASLRIDVTGVPSGEGSPPATARDPRLGPLEPLDGPATTGSIGAATVGRSPALPSVPSSVPSSVPPLAPEWFDAPRGGRLLSTTKG